MKTEIIIKNQARKSLSGNWIPIIAASSVVCIALILFMNIVSMFAFTFNLVDLNTYEIADKNKMFYVIIASVIEMCFVFVSPIINGVIKMAANVVLNEKTEITDMFYFFKGINRYLKTLLINLALFVIYNVITGVLNAYLYASGALNAGLDSGLKLDLTSAILVLSMVVTVIVKILFFFIVIYYPLSYYALDDSKPVSSYVFRLIPFSLRHLGSAIKLTISFLGWILLCFFVVPAIYVLPYYLVSAVNSTRWLVMYDRNRGLI